MVKISVVIPAYNVEKYIFEAISSVVSQSVSPYEVIVIDDGSTDSTGTIIDGFDRVEFVSIVKQKNMGLGLARNVGLERATGDYIYFFDSDDILENDFIERVSELVLENNKPDILYFSGETFYDKGFKGEFYREYYRKISGFYESKDFFISKMVNNKSFFSSACLYISKKSIWIDNGLVFKDMIHEDEEIIFPLSSCAKSIYIEKDSYFRRRIRSGSIMTSANLDKKKLAYFLIVDGMADTAKNINDKYFDKKAFYFRVKKYLFKYLNSSSLGVWGSIKCLSFFCLKIRTLKILYVSFYCFLKWLLRRPFASVQD